MTTTPLIALTMGDAAGIGPEVVLKALSDQRLSSLCRPLIVGHPEVIQRTMRGLNIDRPLRVIAGPQEVGEINSTEFVCWAACSNDVAAVPLGQNDARAGRAAYECLIAATRAALLHQVDAITTAPLSKAALRLAGLNYPGHTEILAEECGVSDFGMMLYLPRGDLIQAEHGLGVVHTTLHTSIRSVPDLLTRAGIAEKIGLMHDFMRQLGCSQPRIAVCALNPHAGEDGLFGDEEAQLIEPAVSLARAAGMNAHGPYPTDTLMRRAVSGEFDGVVAMYHDQGHIALKLIAFDRAVNVTLGLPIVRTSPSHGTAFDIAGQNRASAEGMLEAIKVAAALARHQPKRASRH